MTIAFRRYHGPDDYQLIDDFLIIHYQPENKDRNWVEPAWEYMHGHPMLDRSSLGKIGIWEDDGKLVAVAHYESRLGEAFFQFHPKYKHLRREMIDYAEQNLYGWSEHDGRRTLHAYVDHRDVEFLSLVKERGYVKDAQGARPMAMFVLPDPFPAIALPEGFCLKSLEQDCNWEKVHRVLWRGFNNPGEPPGGDEEIESRKRMFDTPKAQRDLKIIVEAPNGEYASFCGMFYELTHRYAYVEPVATDPTYRRMGLGKAAVLEGIRRCGVLGATAAYVGSDQPFYMSIGFEVIYTSECWVKYLDGDKP